MHFELKIMAFTLRKHKGSGKDALRQYRGSGQKRLLFTRLDRVQATVGEV